MKRHHQIPKHRYTNDLKTGETYWNSWSARKSRCTIISLNNTSVQDRRVNHNDDHSIKHHISQALQFMMTTRQFPKVCYDHGLKTATWTKSVDAKHMTTAQKSSGMLLHVQTVLSAYVPSPMLLDKIRAAVLPSRILN